ncbi:hypothetical protein PHYBOEH_005243 [Phytophthora boehmeriae]|uniref:Uncharacterized protein n=1 Tax=Phytophthora boehmeriae TaxID=109152 RepID=A0A8T1WRH2_9STRA|nr:hypothetical protein PHYBOEH_005243 [Phytophthora boehmeriae]
MASLQERLRLMNEEPRRRQRGQVPDAQVAAALRFQQNFVHRSVEFRTHEISDCADSLDELRNGKREAQESRHMMWEDHYAAQLQGDERQRSAAKMHKLRQETAMLTQLKTDSDKWNMAIDLKLLEFIDATLSVASEDVRRVYFASTNKAGQSPLHRACKTNSIQLVQLLLGLGADLTAKDFMQKSVFHLMAELRLTELFKCLAAMLTDETKEILLGIDANGFSLLHLAAANGSDGILNELLTTSGNEKIKLMVNLVTTEEKQTALHLAALRGHVACARLLLDVAGAKADMYDAKSYNPLHLALHQTFNIDQLVDTFLSYSPQGQLYAIVNALDKESGQSCLHTAIIKNFRQVALAMIRSGNAQINAATRDGGWTALHLAVITEEIEVVQELLTAGATLDAIDADGQTPLLQACLGGQLEVVRFLLDAGANPSHQNKQAHSPLHYLAAFCRDRQLLRDIIAGGADVNAKSMKLNTPMHFAAMNGNEVATQVLLEHGASASVINEDKKSVVYLAKKWRHRSVEDLVRPPEETDEKSDIRSSSASKSKPSSPSHLVQLRALAHARKTPHTRPRTALAMTTRSEESEAESLYDFEDDELILPPSVPWPISVDSRRNSNISSNSNNGVNSNVSSTSNGNCRSFGELRERFFGQRSPLKPVVLARDRQKSVMEELVASRVKLEEVSVPINAHITRFSRRLVVEPVRIPWEMTVPVSHSSQSDALSCQRKLKPSIRTNIGLLRDHLAHAPQLHWPHQARHPVFRKTSS